MSIKERVKDHLTVFETTVLTRGKKKTTNVERALSEIHLWQEIKKLADERLKAAWKYGQSDDGLIPADDKLRKLGKGDHIVVESNTMSCVVKIGDGRQCFDEEAFIATVAKKYKIKSLELTAIASVSKKTSAQPLEKRVLEVSK